jgi:hypothetical protein
MNLALATINGPVGKHQYDVRLGDLFSANYTLVSHVRNIQPPNT